MDPSMETVLGGISRRERFRRHLAIGLAAVAAGALALALALILTRKADPPQGVEPPPPRSCGATARVLAHDLGDPDRHLWLIDALREACTRDHWSDAYLACIARGDGDGCTVELGPEPAGHLRGRIAIALGPPGCYQAVMTIARARRCLPEAAGDLERDVDRIGRELVTGVQPSCQSIEAGAAELAARCEAAAQRPAGPVGFLVITSKPAANVVIDGADTHQATPMRLSLPVGRHKVTFVIAGDKYSFHVAITAGETVSLVKDFR